MDNISTKNEKIVESVLPKLTQELKILNKELDKLHEKNQEMIKSAESFQVKY